jgi:hypothetical protein
VQRGSDRIAAEVFLLGDPLDVAIPFKGGKKVDQLAERVLSSPVADDARWRSHPFVWRFGNGK